MNLRFIRSQRRGPHYALVNIAIGKLKLVDLAMKGRTEQDFEHTIVAYLRSFDELSRNLITQLGENEVEKITSADLFGFRHRPDVAIGQNGTAIETKGISGSHAIRDVLGQAVAYQAQYRYVILVLIDRTPKRTIVECSKGSDSLENKLFTGLSEFLNSFSIVGPIKRSENLVFAPTYNLVTPLLRHSKALALLGT
jgi:hypothetical protein